MGPGVPGTYTGAGRVGGAAGAGATGGGGGVTGAPRAGAAADGGTMGTGVAGSESCALPAGGPHATAAASVTVTQPKRALPTIRASPRAIREPLSAAFHKEVRARGQGHLGGD